MIDAKYIAEALGGKKSGNGYMAPCVAHDDKNPSMSITDGDKVSVVVRCHAGCDQRELIDVLKSRGLWPEKKANGSASPKQIISTYPYLDENGKLLYEVVRFAPKDFRQRHPDGVADWTWNIKGVTPVPYQLPQVLDAIAMGKPVFVVEGEKDVHTMRAHGYVATCNSGGAGKWAAEHSKWLKGADVVIIPDSDSPGRKHAQMVKASLTGIANTVKFITITGAKDVTEWIEAGHTQAELDALLATPIDELNEVSDPPKAREVIVQRLSEIEAKPITWLWPGRIARGKPSVIAGHPGLGKSQITASMTSIVTTGGIWPVDRCRSPIGSVVILSAEDDAADTIRPRLEAAGADVSKVHILQAVIETTENGEVVRGFSLKQDIRRLEDVITAIGDVAMVVIDPVSAYIGSTDSHNNAEIRGLLAPLSEMAARQNVAVVMVSHLNKGGAGSEALLRVTGSLAFVAAARAAFIVAKDPEDEQRKLFMPTKNNLGKDVGGLAFKIEPYTIDNGIETSRVMWDSIPVTDVSADDILRQPTDPEEKGALSEAKAFLEELLADGYMPAKNVFADAKGAGVAERTLRRAAQDLGVVKEKTGMDGGWIWKLPGTKMAKKPEDLQPKSLDTFGEVGHLRAESAEVDF